MVTINVNNEVMGQLNHLFFSSNNPFIRDLLTTDVYPIDIFKSFYLWSNPHFELETNERVSILDFEFYHCDQVIDLMVEMLSVFPFDFRVMCRIDNCYEVQLIPENRMVKVDLDEKYHNYLKDVNIKSNN